MTLWRQSLLAIKYFIMFTLCWMGFALLHSAQAHAAPVVDLIPPGTMPADVEDFLLNCGYTNNASAQIGWLSLAGQPTTTITTVPYGTSNIALQYNVAGIVCDASRQGGLRSTNNGIIVTNPANLGLTGATLNYPYGPTTGNYSVASSVFTYTPSAAFTTDTTVTVQITEKRINVYNVRPLFRCVTNAGDVNPRAPNSGTDYSACISEGNPIVSVRVNVVLPLPVVSCTVAGATIFLGQSYTPSTVVTHSGPSGAPAVTLNGTITIQGQSAEGISGSVGAGGSTTLSGSAHTINAAGTYTVRADMTAVSSRPTIAVACETTLTVRLPDPEITCSVSSPSILAGESSSVTITINHLGPAYAPSVNYNAVVSIDTKPNQSFNGTIANGGVSNQTTTSYVYPAGIYNVRVAVNGNASTSCPGRISSYDQPYVRTYSNDVLAGYGFYDTNSTCPTSDGNVSTFARGASLSYSGSGSQLGTTARGQISGFRSASTLSSAAATPQILSFANTVLVSISSGLYGGSFGSGACMYNYWASNVGANRLASQTIDIGGLGSGSFYSQQLGSEPVVITGRIANGQKIVLYIEGSALLRGASVGYASTAWGARSDIPSLYIIAKGNIAVGSDVRNLDGHYIAQRSNATDGRITSCVDIATAQPYATAAAFLANCSNRLTINGSFNAEHVNLYRTFSSTLNAAPGEPAATSKAAEVFIYPMESFISSQNVNALQQQTYDSITALPPSL